MTCAFWIRNGARERGQALLSKQIEYYAIDSAEKPSVHPSRASEPVLSLTKERTEERVKSLEIFRSC